MKHANAVESMQSDNLSPLGWLARSAAGRMPGDVAAVIVAWAQTWVGCVSAAVLWDLQDPEHCHCVPAGTVEPANWPDLKEASRSDAPHVFRETQRVAIRLCEYPQPAVLLLQVQPGIANAAFLASVTEPLQLAGRHLQRALEWSALQQSHQQLERSDRLQRALFAISDLAGSERDMQAMLRGIHAIVSTLMYAENFFIVLHNAERDTIRFLYYVDQADPACPGDGLDMPLDAIAHTLTWYVIRDGRPCMGDAEELRSQAPGPVTVIGTNSYDWLGVPMLRGGQHDGALVVQSYRPDVSYAESDLTLLQFVGSHILTALERKQSNEDMEQRVQLRTLQLAEANHGLQQEIVERQRAEHLQAALFQLAQLATEDIDEGAFYQRIQAVVGGLLDAESFFIGLLDEDRRRLDFPYYMDTGVLHTVSRPLGRGLSEYVLRHGKPLLASSQDIQALYASGEVTPYEIGDPAVCWLGVPLRVGEEVIGLVAVQSDVDETSYDATDQELLGFVALQIANSIYRRRTAASLQRANLMLEQRVDERTRELLEQIAQREHVQQQLQHQVVHDPLTGLPNRSYMRDRIERALASTRSTSEQCCALLYVDVDRFKIINDSLGHLAGDAVLKEVATRLAACVRHPDLVARLSGDEFVILLETGDMPHDATLVAQRVMDALSVTMPIAGKDLQVTASVGIAIGDQDYGSADELLRDADIALYRAKELGRQRFEVFDETLAQNLVDVLTLEGELRRALRDDEFEPYFQPICWLENDKVVGYEALLRWNHPQRGVLGPDDFLKIAEDSGLIEAIDWRIFELSCERLLAHAPEHAFVTVNVSALHLRHADFDKRLIRLLEKTGLSPTRLVVEVTEHVLLDNPEHVRAMLDRLRKLGVGAALDDFGTGYSSLSYLHSLPLRILKVDQAFVQELDKGVNTSSTTVVAAILALARALGIQVIAEGIETGIQYGALKAMGCEMGQGYLLGRPTAVAHRPTADSNAA